SAISGDKSLEPSLHRRSGASAAVALAGGARMPKIMMFSIGVVCLATAGAAVFGRADEKLDCRRPSESPRPLHLDSAADRDHLTADARQILRVAADFRARVAERPADSESPAAVEKRAALPDRAYAYCTAILAEDIERVHALPRS